MVISTALKKAEEILKNADIGSWLADSRILLCHALGCTRSRLILIEKEEMSAENEKKYFEYINLREKKMPVKYIIGKCEFMGYDFFVKPGVLIPRPDTEIIVEAAIAVTGGKENVRILDICSGSGCIGLSLLKFLKNSTAVLSDISDTAISVSEQNAKRLGVEGSVKIVKKDILSEEIEGEYDLIVSNPPYISDDEYESLMDDVRLYEPKEALNSPNDPFRFYKRILNAFSSNLKPGGYILFEVGYNGSKQVAELISDINSYEDIKIIKDYGGIERVVCARKNPVIN